MPSLDTAPELDEANGLTALMTSGSLDTLVTDWLTADCCAETVPLRGVEHDLPAVPALLREGACSARSGRSRSRCRTPCSC